MDIITGPQLQVELAYLHTRLPAHVKFSKPITTFYYGYSHWKYRFMSSRPPIIPISPNAKDNTGKRPLISILSNVRAIVACHNIKIVLYVDAPLKSKIDPCVVLIDCKHLIAKREPKINF